MPLDSTNWPQTTEVIDETAALLFRARAYLEYGWCRGELARNEIGEGVWPTNSSAVAWCAAGALLAVGTPIVHPAFQRLRDAIGESITIFNNRQETVEPVLAAFDRAIATGHTGRTKG